MQTRVTYSMLAGASINIIDYGASTSNADNYTAISLAIANAASTGHAVYIPAGLYMYGTTLTLSTGIKLIGEGSDASILKYTGVNNAVECASSNSFSCLKIQGTTAANNGIVIGGDNDAYTLCSDFNLSDCEITGFNAMGQVSGVTGEYTQGGSGYSSLTTIIFSAPPTGTTATGTPILSGDRLIGVALTNRGTGYTTPPTITTSGPGTGATLRSYINSTGLVVRACVTGHVSNSYVTRNWRNILFMYGSLNTTWQFDTNNFSYTEGTQSYWNGGPCVQIEGLQSSIWNNTIVEVCGAEAILCYGKYAQNITFNANYYELANVGSKGSVVRLTGDGASAQPIHVNFNNDLIGIQPLYPIPTTNGYTTSTVYSMSEFIYSFEYALYCTINSPKWISENYYYTIYAGANAICCTYFAPVAGGITNQDTDQPLQGIKVLPALVNTPLTLYGYAYDYTSGPVYSLNSTQPTVSSNNKFYVSANTISTGIRTFLDAVSGQEILVKIADAYTYFDVSSPYIFLRDRNVNLIGATIAFLYVNSQWVEQYRTYVENSITTSTGGNTQFYSVANDSITQTIDIIVTGAISATGRITLNGAAHTVTIVSDPSGILATSSIAGKICFYWSASAYRGYNYSGSTLTIQTKLV